MTPNSEANSLLIIDDDADVGIFIQDVADEAGFRTVVAPSFKKFQEVYAPGAFAGILLDLQMPDKDGIEYLRLLCDTGCHSDIVVMSGYDARVLGTAKRFGEEQGLNVVGALQKPVRIDDILAVLERIRSDAKAVTMSDLKRAITNWEFVFDFQPKIRLNPKPGSSPYSEDGRHFVSLGPGRLLLDSFEALIRWRHPDFGILSPDVFIPKIEVSDQVYAFSYKVIESVLDQSAKWARVGFDPVLAINLPAHLAVDPAVPDRVAEMAEAAGVPRNRIVLEVTETAAMENAAQAMSVIGRLRLRNFRVAMDDFGTGYSSLVQLHKMPFNELKIDKSIVLELGINKDAETIIRAIIDLAHNLGLEVCAEGVETAEAYNLLQAFGCDTAQGFHLSRPLAPADAAACAGYSTDDAGQQVQPATFHTINSEG